MPGSSEADALYAEAHRLRECGDLTGALQVLGELVKRAPQHPNALNLTGWLLTTQVPDRGGSLAEGVRLLERAVELFPLETTPLANLVEAHVRGGRAPRALEVATAAVARNPDWPEALNLSGWVKALQLGDVEGGLADLRRAVTLSYWFADARFNLGRVLLAKGEPDAAYEEFVASTQRGSWRNHEAFLRLGELDERRGRLRRALASYRRAAVLDGFGELGAPLQEAVQRVGNALLRQGKFFLHAADEEQRAFFLKTDGLTSLDTPKAKLLGFEAKALLAKTVEPEPRRALEVMIANLGARALQPASADFSPAFVLRPGASAPMKKLLEGYFASWMRWYEALLDLEEPTLGESPETAVFQLGAKGRFAEAATALEAWVCDTEGSMLFRAGAAEQLGDQATLASLKVEAQRLYRVAEDTLVHYAAGSSGSGEGMARMAEVERVRSKLKG